MRAWPFLVALVALAASSGCDKLTYVLVRIDSAELTSADIQRIHIAVTNPTAGADGGPTTYETDVKLCAAGASDGCSSFPITLTLTPGPTRPSAEVRVQVDSYDAADMHVTSDAAIFTFAPDTGAELDFNLYRRCLHSDCATSDQACSSAGLCDNVRPIAIGTAAPDMSPPPASSVTRISAVPGGMEGAFVKITPPATALPGDYVVVVADSGIVSAPAGWTFIGNPANTPTYYRVAGDNESTDTATYTFATAGPTGAAQWVVLVYRNVAALEPGAGGSLAMTPFRLAAFTPTSTIGVIVSILHLAHARTCVQPTGVLDWVAQPMIIAAMVPAAGGTIADIVCDDTSAGAPGNAEFIEFALISR